MTWLRPHSFHTFDAPIRFGEAKREELQWTWFVSLQIGQRGRFGKERIVVVMVSRWLAWRALLRSLDTPLHDDGFNSLLRVLFSAMVLVSFRLHDRICVVHLHLVTFFKVGARLHQLVAEDVSQTSLSGLPRHASRHQFVSLNIKPETGDKKCACTLQPLIY